MKKYILLIGMLLHGILSYSQYTGLTASADGTRFCSNSSVIRVYGSVFAQSNVSPNYHFVGMIYHFYYYNGSFNPIGDYRVTTSSGSLVTSYFNINPVYFDGSQISGGQVISNSYNSGAPLGGGFFSAAINVPWYAFPTSTGMQFYVAVEAIDQGGNTTTVSSKYAFDNPILYGNTALTKPGISATKTTLCGSDQTTISTSPDLSASYSYLWYQDGSIMPGQFAPTLTTASTGTYHAYVYDGCQNVTTDDIVITTGQVPIPPTITSDHGQLLCDGASANLFTTANGGGAITWSNGVTAASTIINTAGSYTANETNACGTSGPSNALVFTVDSKPAAPVITPATNQLLCNGAATTLYSSGSAITWSNGLTSNTITTNVAGTYFTYDQNSCGNSPNSNAVVITTASCAMPAPGTSFQVCPGAMKTLDAGGGYDTYLWSNGATTQTIAVGPGTYHVTVTKNGCSNISNDVTVSYYSVVTPVITASGVTTICAGTSVVLTSSLGSSYVWSDGETGQSITTGNPGGYYVTVTDAHGCPATSASLNIVVNPLPTASISGSTTVCQNSSQPQVVFTGNNATAPYTFTYQVNGGAYQTVTTVSGNTVAVYVPTGAAGTLVYNLVSVRESSGTTCSSAASGSATIIVRQLPTATISGSTAVCRNSTAPQVLFTGSQGTAPYTFIYRINGGANQTVSTTSLSSSVTVNVPTNVAGTFNYQLISVQESSGVTCSNNVSGFAAIVVNPVPTAAISGTTTVCQNSTAPFVTIVGAGGTTPYTFKYQVNGGAVQSVTTTGPSASVDILVPTNVARSFIYSLVSVQDGSSTSCLNTQSGSVTVIVNPQPAVAILKTPDNHLCNGASGQITVFNSVTGYNYTWYKDGALLQNTTVPFINNLSAGSFTVMMTSDKGCDASAISAPLIITIGVVAPPVITGSLRVCPGGLSKLAVAPLDTGQLYDQWRWMDSLQKKIVSRDSLFSAYAGQYHVNVRAQGCYDSTIVTVTANDTAYPAGQLTLSTTSIKYGGQVLLSANTSNSSTYQWDLGDGTTVTGGANQLLQNYFVAGDSLQIIVKATSERNCSNSFSAFLQVAPRITDTVPDLSKTTSLRDWNVFPTPFRNTLKVTMVLTKNESVKIEAFTVDGSFVMAWILAAKKGDNLFTLDHTDSLSSNTLYFVTAVYNGQKHFGKIFKY